MMRNARIQQRKRAKAGNLVRANRPICGGFFFPPLSRQRRRRLEEGGAPPARLRLSPRFRFRRPHQGAEGLRRGCRASCHLALLLGWTAGSGRSVPAGCGGRHGVDRSGVARPRRPDGAGRGASLSAETPRGRGVLDDGDVRLVASSESQRRRKPFRGQSATAPRFWTLEPLHPKRAKRSRLIGCTESVFQLETDSITRFDGWTNEKGNPFANRRGHVVDFLCLTIYKTVPRLSSYMTFLSYIQHSHSSYG